MTALPARRLLLGLLLGLLLRLLRRCLRGLGLLPLALACSVPSHAQPARDHGFLWRVSKDGRSSYLYGTLHVAKLAWMYPGAHIAQALAATDTIALELDLLDPAAGNPRVAGTPAADEDAQERLIAVETGLDELDSGSARAQLLHIAQVWADADLATLMRFEDWCDCLKTKNDRSTGASPRSPMASPGSTRTAGRYSPQSAACT